MNIYFATLRLVFKYREGVFAIKKREVWSDVDKTEYVLYGHVKGGNVIMRQIIHECDPQTATMYLIILSHRNAQTNKCYPSISLLAREMGLSERTVSRMINSLVDNGFLIVNSGKQGITNSYYFPREDFYNGEGVVASRRSGKL